MVEIHRQFHTEHLQYVCISMNYCEIASTNRQIYIQIILTKVTNKFGWFLDGITGNTNTNRLSMECSYCYLPCFF